jgi:hypothetical protein
VKGDQRAKTAPTLVRSNKKGYHAAENAVNWMQGTRRKGG